jgi:hypothetical protein
VGREWVLFRGCDVAPLWADSRPAPPAEAELRAAAIVNTRIKERLVEHLLYREQQE